MMINKMAAMDKICINQPFLILIKFSRNQSMK